jgi:uncharacterized protein
MSSLIARRSIFKTILAGLAGAGTALAATRAQAASGKLKVAYHLSDAEKVGFVLGNIRNHIDGVGGPQNVEIALVVHGPALKAFHEVSANDKIKASIAKLHGEGLALNACGNTMRAQTVELKDLLPGFVKADQGGVVRLAELQSQGYLYLRP